MKIYVVVKVIDDWSACGGGKYPNEVFLDFDKAARYVQKKKHETDYRDRGRISWRLETWEAKKEY